VFGLDGKTASVTGAAWGIGRAIATTFAAQGARVFVLDRDSGGAQETVAAIASLVGIVDRFAYSMTKGAVLTMTRSIAVDFIKDGIRCNCVCPSRVHTPFVDGYLRANDPGREQEMFQQLSKYQPIGRMGTPQEVAALALYLCSDEASFITGQAYPIDGGVLVF
jgi:NAD(P)-dependent dehydrogenase (short-subunit alcohol dehydrogenase family)